MKRIPQAMPVVPNFYFPGKLVLKLNGKDEEIIDVPFESTGKNYEAIEVMECLRQNKTESDKQTFYDTLKIMEIMDSPLSSLVLTV